MDLPLIKARIRTGTDQNAFDLITSPARTPFCLFFFDDISPIKTLQAISQCMQPSLLQATKNIAGTVKDSAVKIIHLIDR
jgi:uncharacterized protein YerC